MAIENSWKRPSQLPCVLYGDTSSATRNAMELLTQHKIPYELSLYHTSAHTPALATPLGVLRGIESIQKFVGQSRD